MKSHKQKYEEAIQRNMSSFRRMPRRYRHHKNIADAKQALGIKQNDTRFDEEIAGLCFSLAE